MDQNNHIEPLKSRWLGGRGTRVLYLAICVTIVGTVMTGQSISQARAESEKAAVSVEAAVKLASEVAELCKGVEFRDDHPQTCQRAAELLKDPSGGGADGLVVIDALGAKR